MNYVYFSKSPLPFLTTGLVRMVLPVTFSVVTEQGRVHSPMKMVFIFLFCLKQKFQFNAANDGGRAHEWTQKSDERYNLIATLQGFYWCCSRGCCRKSGGSSARIFCIDCARWRCRRIPKGCFPSFTLTTVVQAELVQWRTIANIKICIAYLNNYT